MSRPEHIAPPDIYYDDKEAGKYTQNTRIMRVQAEMAERCLELVRLPAGESCLLLDIGCGSGLSGEVLSEAGHTWVGLDISESMLEVAVGNEVEGDVLLADMGQGFGFRAGMFDGAISVSALQWLCYSDKADHKAARRLLAFFTSLYRALRRGARAALQFYPEDEEQIELVTAAAKRCGFGGGLLVDFPNSTKAKKYYLVISAGVDPEAARAAREAAGGAGAAASGGAGSGGGGGGGAAAAAAGGAGAAADDDGMGGPATGVPFEARRHTKRKGKKIYRGSIKDREWVLDKKASRRRKGIVTRPDTKYTGRKRSGHGL